MAKKKSDNIIDNDINTAEYPNIPPTDNDKETAQRAKGNNNVAEDMDAYDAEEFISKHKNFDKIITLITDGMIVFPGMSIPLSFNDRSQIDAAMEAYQSKQLIFLISHKMTGNPADEIIGKSENELEEPIITEREFQEMIETADFEQSIMGLSVEETAKYRKLSAADKKKYLAELTYNVGTLARIFRVEDTKDGKEFFFHTFNAAELKKYVSTTPRLKANVKVLPEFYPEDKDMEVPVMMHEIQNTYKHILDTIGMEEAHNVLKSLNELTHPLAKMNFISINSPLDTASRQDLLQTRSIKERIQKLALALNISAQLVDLKAKIAQKTSQVLTQQQKEHFLRQQINAMQEEIGGGSIEDEEMDELEARAEKMNWSQEVRTHFDKEMRKLERFNASSPEYGIQYGYLETMLNLPWNVFSTDNFDIPTIEQQLEKDHYGLEKVKERIIEHVAVMKLRGDMKAPIMCLYGPPGVGKTSLGKSIAEALGRKYVRIALGGVHDESEIRGHRRTYVGAMPGRIIASLEKAGSSNPVFVLDEIDKIGRDIKGDPSTALLEVLDPEQNDKFHDNYLDIDYDLSKILFITTANSLDTISRPLLDRMEIIEITGYVADEKVAIAKKHLIPKILKEHGLDAEELTFDEAALRNIIESYTRESGVRGLEKTLAKAVRKLAVRKARGEEIQSVITKSDVHELLGNEKVHPDIWENDMPAGVATGLAWTAVGGEILFIETSLTPSKVPKLTLTGQLGDVMKESAALAMEYLKSHSSLLRVDSALFDSYNVHLHVPEGAIPKDGPSAGITMTTALASAFTRRKIKPRLAMTGEITLRGKVLPVGGIKEKILAAKRAGCDIIMMSSENKNDVQEIKAEYLDGLQFHYVDKISQVLDFALTDEIDSSLPELKVLPPQPKEK
ncbi:MAG: endopeptidase La [Prevotella sp.]|nr:endopeptidase La [Prevotella sp.]MCM1074258.1 endopeptidase La [Ruminococcus sp.]